MISLQLKFVNLTSCRIKIVPIEFCLNWNIGIIIILLMHLFLVEKRRRITSNDTCRHQTKRTILKSIGGDET